MFKSLFAMLTGMFISSNPDPSVIHIRGNVTEVIDGDTIYIRANDKKKYKIRLYGIDTPEKKQPVYEEARNALVLLTLYRHVTVNYEKKGVYGRIIGKIYVDDLYINKEMIKSGYAWHYKKYSKDKDLAQAEKHARLLKLNIWSRENPIAPWDWRKGKRVYMSNLPSIKNPYPAPLKKTTEYFYTLNTKTKIRHNEKCVYFNKSKNNISCTVDKGNPCKKCGG